MPASFHDPAVLEHQDLIRGLHGREAVGNDERRTANQCSSERLLDGAFRFRIEVGGGFIQNYQPGDAQIAWYLARFITDVRSLSIDPVLVRQNWLEAYDFATDKAAIFLNDYARINDPFGKVGKAQIAVEVSSVIRASDDSFRIAWTERHYVDDALAATERWSAILTIVVQTPTDADRLKKNPLGLYVHALNWSKELG